MLIKIIMPNNRVLQKVRLAYNSYIFFSNNIIFYRLFSVESNYVACIPTKKQHKL